MIYIIVISDDPSDKALDQKNNFLKGCIIMPLIKTLRNEICAGRIPPIFKGSDLQAAGIDDPNYNLSNYDKKNKGSLNKKVLVSREISGEVFYTFDEQIFD